MFAIKIGAKILFYNIASQCGPFRGLGGGAPSFPDGDWSGSVLSISALEEYTVRKSI